MQKIKSVTIIAALIGVVGVALTVGATLAVPFIEHWLENRDGLPPTETPIPAKGAAEFEVKVFSYTEPYKSTNIYVEQGDKLEITVLGDNPGWDCGRDELVGPDGYTEEPYGDTVYPQSPVCALIGSISNADPERFFLIGKHVTLTAPESGYLFMGCNDSVDRFEDNPTDSGLEVEVVIRQ